MAGRTLSRAGRELTRVAVIADTHLPRGSRRLPEECLRLLAESELILHAGDFVTRTVLEELAALAPVEAVRGNMDDPELQEALPEQRIVEVAGRRIGMVHVPGPAAGRAGRLATRFAGCDAVVYGHTHMPEAIRHGSMWILNPGSPTERRGAPARSMLVLEIDDRKVRPQPITFEA